MKAIFLSLLFCSMIGCVASNNVIGFSSTDYPISMSSTVLMKDRSIVHADLKIKKGSLRAAAKGWSLFWGQIPLNTVDFSEEVNAQVRAAGGDSVANLRFKVSQDGFLNQLGSLLLYWLPIWPGNVEIEITGDIL